MIEEADAVPYVEAQDFPLGTDEPVFWYGNARVHRDEREALNYLLGELAQVSDDVQKAMHATMKRLVELCREGEP